MKSKKDFKNTGRKILKIAITGIFLFCTAVGGWGILTAPALAENSDMEELRRELERNEKILEKQNNTYIESDVYYDEEKEAHLETSVQAGKLDNEEEKESKADSITAIGDSIILDAALSVQDALGGAVIDAKISRQVYQAMEVAKSLKKKKKLGNIIIIALGSNGLFTSTTGQELIDYLGEDREIYWINTYGKDKKIPWQKDTNKIIQSLAEKNENVHVIDWESYGAKHPNWFYSDGIHLNPKGQEGYAKFLKKEIFQ